MSFCLCVLYLSCLPLAVAVKEPSTLLSICSDNAAPGQSVCSSSHSVSPGCRLSYCKDNANREQNHQACLNVMPRCRLSYAKIMQIESRIIKSCLNVMPRCSLSYCKDNAIWHNYKIKICQLSHKFSSIPLLSVIFQSKCLIPSHS